MFTLQWVVLFLLNLIILELIFTTSVFASLSYILCLSLCIGTLLVSIGLELLAASVIIIYCGLTLVFYFVSLVWLGALDNLKLKTAGVNKITMACFGVFLVFFIYFLYLLLVKTTPSLVSFELRTLWSDLLLLTNIAFTNFTHILHLLLMRYFFIESLLLNVVLLLGFSLCIFSVLDLKKKIKVRKSTPLKHNVSRSWKHAHSSLWR